MPSTGDIVKLDELALKSELPNLSGYALKSELPNLSGYALKSEILNNCWNFCYIVYFPSETTIVSRDSKSGSPTLWEIKYTFSHNRNIIIKPINVLSQNETMMTNITEHLSFSDKYLTAYSRISKPSVTVIAYSL
jgi:hypothetical protein